MAGLDAVKAQVLAAFPSGIGRTRLAAVYTARRRALEAPPADWGDRAILLGRHIEDARGLDALGVADAELAAAEAAGMPADLVGPLSLRIAAKRAAAASTSRKAQPPVAEDDGR